MLIAMATELFYPHVGGSESRFLELGKRLVNHGHEVHIFTIQHEKALPIEDITDGIQIHRYAYSRNYIKYNGLRSLSGVLKYSLTTTTKILDNKFDVYYFSQWPILHTILAKPFVSPLVQEWCEVWYKRIALLERATKKAADYHVAVSNFTERRMIDFLGIKPDRTTVIPNGVDLKKFIAKSHKKKWGRIIYVGRIVPHKHVEMLIDAFRQVKREIPEAELHIVGSGPILPTIKEQVLPFPDIYFHGYLPESRLLDILQSSWLFVLPSEREGSGIVALEAMAAGLPVITVNYEDNATKDYAKYGSCLVVDPNYHAVASAILSLLHDENLWKEMSRHAFELAKQYDWDAATNLFESFLKQIIEVEPT